MLVRYHLAESYQDGGKDDVRLGIDTAKDKGKYTLLHHFSTPTLARLALVAKSALRVRGYLVQGRSSFK